MKHTTYAKTEPGKKIEDSNKPVIYEDTESAIKSLQRKGKDMMVSLVSLLITQRNSVSPYQTLPKSWGKLKKKKTFPNSFYRVSIILSQSQKKIPQENKSAEKYPS